MPGAGPLSSMDSTAYLRLHGVTEMGNVRADRTLLLVHGFGTDQKSWGALAERLKHEYRIVAFDTAGVHQLPVGKQHREPGDVEPADAREHPDLEGFAGDVIGICDALKLQQTILVGQSAGGIIACLAVVRRPELFSKLVLIGTSPRYLNDGAYLGGFTPSDLDGVERQMEADYADWVRGFTPWICANRDHPHITAYLALTLSRLRPALARRICMLILRMDYRHLLPRIQQPTLILQTAGDPAVPPSVGEFMRRTMPNAELRQVQVAGHFPQMAEPDEVAAPIRAFA